MLKNTCFILVSFCFVLTVAADDERLIRKFEGHTDRTTSAVFGATDDIFVSCAMDGKVILWKINGDDVKSVVLNLGTKAYSAAVGDDGRSVAAAGEDMSIFFWNAGSNEPVKRLNAHTAPLLCAAYTKKGSGWASGGKDSNIFLWNGGANDAVGKLAGHADAVLSVEFNSDGTRLVSAAGDKCAAIWDTRTKKYIHVLKGHKKEVRCASFNADASKVITGSYDGTAIIWDAKTGKQLKLIKTPHEKVFGAVFTSDENKVITGGSGKINLIIWDAQKETMLEKLTGHDSTVSSLSVSPNGKKLLSCGGNDVFLWDISEK
ncbi:MAG: WD40 repeat domain-containing protein [Planctomycetaceae bacterium]|nr:WD40 repeat domain-containing protein [Planctomycetaceae bacterium]